uniref:B30.2/SPRY domain-containing protein n=1 Tax=Erpetoichthys calabaricus TaxID=27687 RepID=A0A8C4SZS5_ERPCA
VCPVCSQAMAEAQLFTYHDENSCSVCLDSLTDPVSLHCGHSFCLKCFTNLWDQSQECSCPECGESFTMRPELHINTVLNEDIKKLKMVRLNPHPSQNYAGPGNVECDVCTRKKSRAVMSCLTCAVSYCLTHLQPHFEVAAWKDHKLTDPLTPLQRWWDGIEGAGEIKKQNPHSAASFVQMSSLVFFSLLSDFCPLTLNINTAHRDLHLTEGNRKVTREGTKANYPDHLNRFDCWPQVLCREALTGTRCYWEVECTGDNLAIGVAYQGLSRKGDGMECSLGNNDKSWSLYCSYSQYSVYHNNKCTILSTPYSPRIGVYLDWPAGSLSFYSVSHTMTLLHRLNTFFTKPLYPGFGVGPDCSVTICHLTPDDN